MLNHIEIKSDKDRDSRINNCLLAINQGVVCHSFTSPEKKMKNPLHAVTEYLLKKKLNKDYFSFIHVFIGHRGLLFCSPVFVLLLFWDLASLHELGWLWTHGPSPMFTVSGQFTCISIHVYESFICYIKDILTIPLKYFMKNH